MLPPAFSDDRRLFFVAFNTVFRGKKTRGGKGYLSKTEKTEKKKEDSAQYSHFLCQHPLPLPSL